MLGHLTPSWIGSPNFHMGRDGHRPTAVVIHIAEGSAAAVDSWFRNPASSVSAHYLVTKAGDLHQYVLEENTAWHAGRVDHPTWTGLAAGLNPNKYTIGIEHEGGAADLWPDVMYERSARLLAEIHARWSISLDRSRIVGHREIYSLKTCPGSAVELDKLIKIARSIVGIP